MKQTLDMTRGTETRSQLSNAHKQVLVPLTLLDRNGLRAHAQN